MQCKNCDYPLWNLKARQCPECGQAFLPSEFEFVVNSVCFCCPHCKQGYYGTGERGHLVPAEFDCVTCKQRITMDEMVLFPASGVQDHETKIDQAPWLNRERHGWFKAWFKTVFQGLFMPNTLIRGVPPESSSGQAWWFAIVTAAIFSCVNLLTFIGIIFLIAAVFGGTGGMSGTISFATAMFVSVVIAFLSLMLITVVWGLTTHGVLLILGGGKWGIGRTFHAICYSMGGAALFALPLLGIYPFGFIPLLWWMVSAMVMVGIAQGVSAGKAIVATGVFPLVMTLIVFGGFFAAIYFSMTMAQTAIAQASAATTTTAVQIMQQQIIPAAEAEGEFPRFALEAVDADALKLSDFHSPMSLTDLNRVRIGERGFWEIMALPPEELAALVERIGAAMPEDVVAHRVIDYVFTYHGMEVDAQDSTLWVIVIAPSPQPDGRPAFSGPGFGNQITVIKSDGSSITYPLDQFDAALEEQNAVRTERGLPELPDPRTITLEKPVVRADGEREQYGGDEP